MGPLWGLRQLWPRRTLRTFVIFQSLLRSERSQRKGWVVSWSFKGVEKEELLWGPGGGVGYCGAGYPWPRAVWRTDDLARANAIPGNRSLSRTSGHTQQLHYYRWLSPHAPFSASSRYFMSLLPRDVFFEYKVKKLFTSRTNKPSPQLDPVGGAWAGPGCAGLPQGSCSRTPSPSLGAGVGRA